MTTGYIDLPADVGGTVDLATEVTGILPIANGGTGSATQNFVDLTTGQSVGGLKNFTDALTVTSNNATSLAVGPNGTTNPVFQVDSSTASQATGVKVTGAAAAGGASISVISSGATEDLALASKGGGSIKLQVNSLNKYIASQYAHTFTSTAYLGANTIRFGVTGSSDLTLTASTEAPNVYFNMGQTRQHATGALSLQRDFRITPSTHSFVGASTLANASSLSIDGPSNGGTNATIASSSALYIPTSALTNVTYAYGIYVEPSTGATSNYGSYFGGRNGFGMINPVSVIHAMESNATTSAVNGITIEQQSTGDASLHFYLPGQQRYTMGIDNSDSDKFKIGANADLGTSNLFTLTNAGSVGVGTTNPTNTLTLASGGTGQALYNTADQTTNYERGIFMWSGNTLFLGTELGGTGQYRTMKIGSAGTAGGSIARSLDFNGTAPFFKVSNSTSIAGNNFDFSGILLSGSNVSQNIFVINPTINQSGTSSYTALLVNPTETATGSGNKFLADFQVGGVSKVAILNSGNVGIGVTSPNANAILDVTSTTKAFMPPRMTTTQKNNIASPTAGMVVYDSTLNKLCVYTTAWETVTSS